MTHNTPEGLPPSVLQQALEALEYHQEQTRPIEKTQATIAAIREALRAQAASVEPVGSVDHVEWCSHHQKWRHNIWADKKIPFGTPLYAGAPPSPAHIPADVEAVRWPAAWEQARQQACRAVEGHRGLKTDAILESTIAAGVRAAFEDLWYVLQKSYADVSPPQAPQAVGRAQIAIYERLLPLIATCLKHQQVNSASELMRQLDGEIAALATKGQKS